MTQNQRAYRELADKINKTINRRAVTVDLIKQVVAKAKETRKRQGVFGLMAYATQIPSRFFSPEEIEQLKGSPYWKSFSERMIDLMVAEDVITPQQANMVKRTL